MTPCPSQDVTICELTSLINGKSPSTTWLRKLFLTLARVHLSSASNYGDLAEELDGLVWSATEVNGRLAVSLTSPASTSIASGQIPGVYVNVGQLNYSGDVNGDVEGDTEDNALRVLTTRASSMVQLVCLHTDADASANLGNTLLAFFQSIKGFLATINIFGFTPDSMMGPDTKKAGDTTYYQTLVMFKFQFHQRVTVSLGGHKLRGISFNIKKEGDVLSEPL